MAKRFNLTENDRRVIKELVRKSEEQRVNPPSRPSQDPTVGEDHQAPEVYIAKPQSSSGIPALSSSTPGKDTCDIYRINNSDILEAVTGFSQPVYNLSNLPIPQDWIVVERTKFGKWIVSSPEAASDQVAYYKAQSDWEDNDGSSKVSCKLSTRLGVSVTGDALDVFLPIRVPNGSSTDYTIQRMPNVLSGDIIHVTTDVDGNKVAIDYLAQAHLVITMFSGSTINVPAGWALCNGSANAAVSGGDDTDLSGFFIVAYNAGDGDFDAIGKTGGAKTHGPGISPTGHDTTAGPKGHEDHVHYEEDGVTPWNGGHSSGEFISGPPAGLDPDAQTAEHPPIDTHEHDSHDAANHLPPFYVLAFIQRVVPWDNS